MNELKFGFTACYIRDYPFNHICDIPDHVALAWAAEFIKISDLQGEQFVIVGGDHGKYVAINYNSNGVYSLYVQREVNSGKKSDKELKKLYEEKINTLLKNSVALKKEGPTSISLIDFNNLPEVKELVTELQKEGITKEWLMINGFVGASLIINI